MFKNQYNWAKKQVRNAVDQIDAKTGLITTITTGATVLSTNVRAALPVEVTDQFDLMIEDVTEAGGLVTIVVLTVAAFYILFRMFKRG